MTTESDWLSSIPIPPRRHQLAAMFMTTYRPAEAPLLVEHLLPSLLHLSRSPTNEPEGRALFFGELAVRLERLRGRMTIVSSTADEDGDHNFSAATKPQYPWLWRYVSPFTVGATGQAVQHAKLWMFHWRSDTEPDLLELFVSSTNLTEAAFRGQLQCGWRATVELGDRPTQANLSSWGILPDFLQVLTASAGGPEAPKRAAYFVDLLGKAACPDDVSFVATVPSTVREPGDDRRWGARALRAVAPEDRGSLEVRICVPFVGGWNGETLEAWCKALGTDPDRLGLAWIDESHPWAGISGGEWRLSKSALDCLTSAGVQVERLGHVRAGPVSRFHPDHRDGDPRWSHAKFYGLRRGRVRKLLITSANFSASAWGAGVQPARNFELGVVLDADWPIDPDELMAFDDEYAPFTTSELERVADRHIVWAAASWDGRQIEATCRLASEEQTITGLVQAQGNSVPAELKFDDVGSQTWAARLAWDDGRGLPFSVTFSVAEEHLEVPVVDLRPDEEFVLLPVPEVSPEAEEALRDALLLEMYGGPTVESGDIPGLSEPSGGGEASSAIGGGDYSVAAMEQAREWFDVVGTWLEELKRCSNVEPGALSRVRADGERLLAIFQRRSEDDPVFKGAARVVAQELTWRLEEVRRAG
ncbi:MAG: hypothetical protein JST54_26640 [Deltaproteobacteria bacterium]|nr:hypothetical protein [Deltaproteobacteria bacterium]